MTHNETTLRVTRWDAGELACGGLVVGLKQRLDDLRTGDLLEVTARDVGAAADIPSWCRMSGQQLVLAQPPHYFIQKTKMQRKSS